MARVSGHSGSPTSADRGDAGRAATTELFERGLVGGLLLNASRISEVDELEADDFANPRLGTAFDAVRRLQRSGSEVELASVAKELHSHRRLDPADSAIQLAQLMDKAPVVWCSIQHARAIRVASRQREQTRLHRQACEHGSTTELIMQIARLQVAIVGHVVSTRAARAPELRSGRNSVIRAASRLFAPTASCVAECKASLT